MKKKMLITRIDMDRKTGRGPPEQNRQIGGHGRAGSSGGHGRSSSGALDSVPSARPLQPEPFLPPPKKFPVVVKGYQQPSGAKHTGTGQSTLEQDTAQEQYALRGQARKLRSILGMTSQGPHRVASGTPSTSTTGRAVCWEWLPWP